MSTDTATLKPESFDGQEADSVGNPSNIQESLRASGSHAARAAEELRAAAEAKAKELGTMMGEKASEFRDKAGDMYDDAKVQLKALQKDTEEYVRANPIKAVLIAVGAGFVIGSLARR
jgi:ElaB/YqjD/DUF883 family membrane-anchored ribosome-binding protein